MFNPSLPSPFTRAIECLGFGLINKVFLDFGISWWKPNTEGFQLLWTEGTFCNKKLASWTRDMTGFDVLPNHEGILLGWLDKISPVKECLRTQWNANKYVRGSYSHITTRCDADGITPCCLSEPIWGKSKKKCNEDVPIMMFAGEATHEHFYSTTHGAYDTGVKQAQIFLQHHVTKS
ncbi:PREDICTED: peroxisomal N(1)-acetyl-spermine/spermidine oxidase-like [Habropoda laboriosa]|uniref:peroxisomal N(1)-acetyl-spermine/spermidine oxidase-like n=1 Tax=Habropoda laboriosa TaxID=597456 RepID=UPI00083D5575|nr:PREDICTED: peroxisomal N(1)-acetyl-spermine/spermidine oxidase-like [Habropoda laboriosa]